MPDSETKAMPIVSFRSARTLRDKPQILPESDAAPLDQASNTPVSEENTPAQMSPASAEAVPVPVPELKPEPEPEPETATTVPAQDTNTLQSFEEPPTTTALRKMKVLTAEDNKTNQLVFRKMVKDLDIELQFANNGEEAVDAYQSYGPDMIFMDISMPKMDGKSATKAIRALEAHTGGHIPIVALTAHAMNGDDNGILAAGLDHYLTKPMRKNEIHAAIAMHCPADIHPPNPMVELSEAG